VIGSAPWDWPGDALSWAWDTAAGAVNGVAGDALRAFTAWVAAGAGWLLEHCFMALAATTDPRPGEGWFQTAYLHMAMIGAAFAMPCLMLGIIQALLRQDAALLGRVIAAVPGSVLLTVAAVAVTQMLLGVVDHLSLWLAAQSGTTLAGFGARLGRLIVAGGGGVTLFVMFVVAVVVAFAALVLWVELLVRAAIVYALLGFFPLAAALMIWPATAGAVKRLSRLLLAIILSKLAMVWVVSLGAIAIDQSGVADRFEGLLAGGALVGMACFAPMAVLRLLPLVEEAVSVRGNLGAHGAGGLARRASRIDPQSARENLHRQAAFMRGGVAALMSARPVAAASRIAPIPVALATARRAMPVAAARVKSAASRGGS
jgi:hypothetical protein